MLCIQIQYTDGDDAYFYGMAHSMSFFEYLKMRYITWEGRMTSEAMTYISMFFGKAFWNVANAVVLTLLVGGMTKIVHSINSKLEPKRRLLLLWFMCLSILLMEVGVIGYGAFWVTGSTFYLWSITAGIWAAVPIAQLVCSCETLSSKSYIYAIPCGFIAAMGLEQIAAVVITFGVLALGYHYITTKEIHWLTTIQIVIMVIGLAILFVSPGTAERSLTEIELWMPQFHTMPVSQHLFITVQWMISGFANYHKWYVCIILLLLLVLIEEKLKHNRGNLEFAPKSKYEIGKKVWRVLIVLGILTPWLSYITDKLTNLGMGDVSQEKCVTKVASLEGLTGMQVFACIWQLGLMVLMLILLWKTGETFLEKAILILLVLAGIASAGVMYFSPTMYSSGARVMFVTAIMLWLVSGILFMKIKSKKVQIGLCVLVTVIGAVNVGYSFLIMGL